MDPPSGPDDPRDTKAEARTLETVSRARDELGLILHAIPAGITVQDAAGALIYANDPAAAACGFASGAEMTSAPVAEILRRFRIWDQEGRPLEAADLPGRQALGGQVSERLVRFRRTADPDGDRWVSIKAVPVPDEQGRVVRVVNVFRDITERRRSDLWQQFLGEASAALASSLDLDSLLQTIADLAVRSVADWCAIDMRQPDGTVRHVALAHGDTERLARVRAWDAGAGRSPDARVFSLAVMRDGKAQLLARIGDDLLLELARNPEHLALLRSLGVESAVTVPLSARGQVIGAITLVTSDGLPRYGQADLAAGQDLGRRVSVTIDNLRLYGEAQEALRAREDLLAIVSHDLRNPLGVVLASSALLLKSSLPPEKEERARRQVEAIQRAGNRMNRLIRDLLDFASIQGGRLSISPRDQQAADLVGEVLDMIEPLATQKSLRLTNELAGREIGVRCDHDRMIQVFSNVIGNAIKFTPEGGTIRVGAAPDGNFVRFFVADSGPGISADELSHVFDRYFQARRKNRDGIGLGLSIAKGIVDAHGGRISVESQEGQGSTFFVTLPAAG